MAEPQAKLLIGDDAEVARILLGEHECFAQGADAPLWGSVFDEGALWRSQGGVWQLVDEAEVMRLVMAFSGMPKPTQDGGESPLKVSAGMARSVAALVQASAAQPGFFAQGAWGVAFRDTFLRIDINGSTTLEALTPDHRCRFALDFAYNPTAPLPTDFLTFLQSIWGDDTEQKVMLLEWIGYLLSGRTDFQKIFLMIGPPRSGKGTILRLIQHIFGRAACPFKAATLGERFQVGALAGKSVAYDPDVRRAAITDGSESKSVEMLLSISGEDQIVLEQKYLKSAFGKLGARLMLCTNTGAFRMADVGAALSTRLLVSTMTESFLGKEDTRLDAKLRLEVPGILALAIHGLCALSARGRFVEPESSQEEKRTIERSETPMLVFLDERCERGSPNDESYNVKCSTLYEELSKWCAETGHRRPSDTTFGETLRRLKVPKVRPNAANRERVYKGIRLLPCAPKFGPPKLRVVEGSQSS